MMCYNIFLFCLMVQRALPVNDLTNQFANKPIKLQCQERTKLMISELITNLQCIFGLGYQHNLYEFFAFLVFNGMQYSSMTIYIVH